MDPKAKGTTGLALLGGDKTVTLDAADWPRWVWGVLCAMNLTVMIIVALLLLGLP